LVSVGARSHSIGSHWAAFTSIPGTASEFVLETNLDWSRIDFRLSEQRCRIREPRGRSTDSGVLNTDPSHRPAGAIAEKENGPAPRRGSGAGPLGRGARRLPGADPVGLLNNSASGCDPAQCEAGQCPPISQSVAPSKLSRALADSAMLVLQHPSLYIEVQEELMRMRPQPYRVHLGRGFVFDPHVEHVLGENIALR